MERATYVVTVVRDDDWLVLDAPEVPFRTQAPTLADVEPMVREAIGLRLDAPENSFDLDFRITGVGPGRPMAATETGRFVATYHYRTRWHEESQEFLATVAEFPNLSCLESSAATAFEGLFGVVEAMVSWLVEEGEAVPVALG